MSIDQAFIEFVMDNKLDEKHNIDQAFKYDYTTDEIDYTTLDKEALGKKSPDNFYLDGVDMWNAFKAGMQFSESLKK